MSTPGQFEQWARDEGLISESHGVRFVNSQCDVARKAWQASRTAAIEEAAQAVEKHDVTGREWVAGSFWDVLSREAAGRIRALGKGEN